MRSARIVSRFPTILELSDFVLHYGAREGLSRSAQQMPATGVARPSGKAYVSKGVGFGAKKKSPKGHYPTRGLGRGHVAQVGGRLRWGVRHIRITAGFRFKSIWTYIPRFSPLPGVFLFLCGGEGGSNKNASTLAVSPNRFTVRAIYRLPIAWPGNATEFYD
jgi:hypothetical protein